MNPHSKVVQIWTKFFAVSSLLAIFIDPLFFFIILVQKVYIYVSSWISFFRLNTFLTIFLTAEQQMHSD